MTRPLSHRPPESLSLTPLLILVPESFVLPMAIPLSAVQPARFEDHDISDAAIPPADADVPWSRARRRTWWQRTGTSARCPVKAVTSVTTTTWTSPPRAQIACALGLLRPGPRPGRDCRRRYRCRPVRWRRPAARGHPWVHAKSPYTRPGADVTSVRTSTRAERPRSATISTTSPVHPPSAPRNSTTPTVLALGTMRHTSAVAHRGVSHRRPDPNEPLRLRPLAAARRRTSYDCSPRAPRHAAYLHLENCEGIGYKLRTGYQLNAVRPALGRSEPALLTRIDRTQGVPGNALSDVCTLERSRHRLARLRRLPRVRLQIYISCTTTRNVTYSSTLFCLALQIAQVTRPKPQSVFLFMLCRSYSSNSFISLSVPLLTAIISIGLCWGWRNNTKSFSLGLLHISSDYSCDISRSQV
ncbi:hypothetical protein B0H10DRAFT_746699 [Mycena sp. CBHHK59/15]|nr:hypothetical protein B0H10DRAFT_746699 [Mycena sp. CBHHK59/15]